jgi:hypothetical protein
VSTVVAPEQRALRQPRPAARPALEVVGRRTHRVRRRRAAPVLAAVFVSGSLLTVVLGHAELAQQQVRLTSVEADVTAAQAVHHQEELSLANLENPTRIVSEAELTLHMVTPRQVDQLPYVSLEVPLAAPTVLPASSGARSPTVATPGN